MRKYLWLVQNDISTGNGWGFPVITHLSVYNMANQLLSQKGGYDYDFVETPAKFLECSICLLTLRDPHVSSCCGNHFCQPCISQVQERSRPCPLCNEQDFTTLLHKGVQREVNSLKIYCTWKRLGCDWQGELAKLREHLELRKGGPTGCGFVMVECSNKCGEMVERRGLLEHEVEECPMRSIEVQMSSLTRKLEKRLTIVEKNLERVLREKEGIERQLSCIEEQNKSLVEDNHILKNELEAVKRKFIHSINMPPFYYTLYNFKYYQQADIVLFSPPFYSHPAGYKLRLQIYPNGTKMGKNRDVSLIISIMLGEYDADLKWPFNGVIVVELFNCSANAWDLTTDFHMGPGISSGRCVKRPMDCVANDGSGIMTWLSHDELFQHYVIPGYDFVRFRVREVQLFD